jgi:hypothetical protein
MDKSEQNYTFLALFLLFIQRGQSIAQFINILFSLRPIRIELY